MPKSSHILIVVNPQSGDCSGDEVAKFTRAELDKKQILHSTFRTTGNFDSKKLRQKILDKPPKRVLVIGGDGTVNLVAEILEKSSIVLGIIPAGSANGLARNFEIPESS